MKTVLVPGVPWPEVGEWPERPKFEHKQKPVRQLKPRTAPKKRGRKPKVKDITEAVLKAEAAPQRPERKKYKRPKLEKKPDFKLDFFSSAREQLANPETRRSKHKHAIKNLEGHRCTTTN